MHLARGILRHQAQAPAASACDLLTVAEVEAAAGWKPGAPKVESYGSTSTCTLTGNALKREVVVLTVEAAEALAKKAIPRVR